MHNNSTLMVPYEEVSLSGSNSIRMTIRTGDIYTHTMIAKFDNPGEGILAIKYLYKYLAENHSRNLVTMRCFIRVSDIVIPSVIKYFNNSMRTEYPVFDVQLEVVLNRLIDDYKKFVVDSFKNMMVDFSEENKFTKIIGDIDVDDLDWIFEYKINSNFPAIIVMSQKYTGSDIKYQFQDFLYGEVSESY